MGSVLYLLHTSHCHGSNTCGLLSQGSPPAALPWVDQHVRLPNGAKHANGHFRGAGPGPGPGSGAATELASAPSLSSSPGAAAALDAAGSAYSRCAASPC